MLSIVIISCAHRLLARSVTVHAPLASRSLTISGQCAVVHQPCLCNSSVDICLPRQRSSHARRAAGVRTSNFSDNHVVEASQRVHCAALETKGVFQVAWQGFYLCLPGKGGGADVHVASLPPSAKGLQHRHLMALLLTYSIYREPISKSNKFIAECDRGVVHPCALHLPFPLQCFPLSSISDFRFPYLHFQHPRRTSK